MIETVALLFLFASIGLTFQNEPKVKELIAKLEVSFPTKGISLEELEQKMRGAIDDELAYSKKKKWVEERQGLWYAMPKGVDASIKMQKGKECFEIDP